MPKYLLEVPHEAEKLQCARIVRDFLSTGSHFLTHTDWGCGDGVHIGWITVEVESKDEARMILPPTARSSARIVALNKFTIEEMDEIIKKHQR